MMSLYEMLSCFSSIFCTSDIKGLEEVDKVEELNKKYWYACQRYLDVRSAQRNGTQVNGSAGSSRFRDLMLCLPEIRLVVGQLLSCDFSKLPLLFKVGHSFTFAKY